MKLLDLSLGAPHENLACDEALLELAEAGLSGEVLRFWESRIPFVVLGYSNRYATESNVEYCKKAGIPILRRPSGGGTVLQGPGCLNFSLILKIPAKGPLAHLVPTNQFILETHKLALNPFLNHDVHVKGVSDLTFGNLKFSGNAQRRKRDYLLFHGTFLHGFDLKLISAALNHPAQEPEYREKREHKDFITNIPLTTVLIKGALQKAWNAREVMKGFDAKTIPVELIEKYQKNDWNLKY